MTRFLSLLTFTEKGLRDIQDSASRAAQFRKSVSDAGGKVLAIYWAVGEVDGCVVFEAPDDSTASALLLDLGRQGNVRTRSMRVYDDSEFNQILSTL